MLTSGAAAGCLGSALLTLLVWDHPLARPLLQERGLPAVATTAALVWVGAALTLRAIKGTMLPPAGRLLGWGILHVGLASGVATVASAALHASVHDTVAAVLAGAGTPAVVAGLGLVLSTTLALAIGYTHERAQRLAHGMMAVAQATLRQLGHGARLAGRGLSATGRALRPIWPLLLTMASAAASETAALLQRVAARRSRSDTVSTVEPPEDEDTILLEDLGLPAADVEAAAPAAARARATAPAALPAQPADAAGPQVGRWQLPPLTLLELPPENGSAQAASERTTQLERKIERTLAEFDIPVRVVESRIGPTVTQFGIEPGYRERHDRKGTLIRRDRVKVREILARQYDLALALASPSIRIEAPVPGRPVVGIEVPNHAKAMVALRTLLETEQFRRLRDRGRLPIALGEFLSKEAVVADLTKMPHVLIAGATGSGKSVCINALIATLLMFHTPETLRLLLVDPKRVEMTAYGDLPHLLAPVVVEAEKTVPALRLVLQEMDQRYRAFAEAGVRNIDGWNRLGGERKRLPYIVVVIDELADLMMLAPDEVERSICRLAQLARATGIHLVVATQRPSVDVVTGLIKANIPTRVSFMVTSQVDSRTILDMSGAEKLLGSGDMLYMPTDLAKPLRLQGTYVSDDEIEGIVQFWTRQGGPQYAPDFANLPAWSPHDDGDEDDELHESAVELAQQLADQGKDLSVSFLQRRLRIGYNRAARLKERLLSEGLLGEIADEPEALALARAGDADDE